MTAFKWSIWRTDTAKIKNKWNVSMNINTIKYNNNYIKLNGCIYKMSDLNVYFCLNLLLFSFNFVLILLFITFPFNLFIFKFTYVFFYYFPYLFFQTFISAFNYLLYFILYLYFCFLMQILGINWLYLLFFQNQRI